MDTDRVRDVIEELGDRFNELLDGGDVTGQFARLDFHDNEALCLFAAAYAMRNVEDRAAGEVSGKISVLPDEQSSDVAAAMVGGFILGLDYARRHGLSKGTSLDLWEF